VDLPLTSVQEAERYRRSGSWPDVTLFERIEASARKHPTRTALIDAHGSRTYAELIADVTALAHGLLEAGVRAGDVVSVQLPNCADQPITHLALNRIGALAMPIHDSWHGSELAHLLDLSGAVMSIVPASFRGVDYPAIYAGLRGSLPRLREVYAIGESHPKAKKYRDLFLRGRDEATLAPHRPDPDAPGALKLSSGTTSLPKVSVYSSNDLQALLGPFIRRLALSENDIGAALAPAGTGSAGYVYPVIAPLMVGASCAMLEKWGDPEAAIEFMRSHRCTFATAVPAQLTQMLPVLQGQGSSALGLRAFTVAGSPLPEDVGREFERIVGAQIISIYGATDGSVATCNAIGDDQTRRLTTVGTAQEDVDLRLAGPTGEWLGPGEEGEIQWRTAAKSYGYLNDEAATAAAFTADRFYRSGDLGRIDANGYLRVTGRIKDVIIRGGRNLSPRLIEEQAQKHPCVLDVAVAGYKDAVLGERACAFVVARPGASLDLTGLVAFLRDQGMPVWQLPERLELMDELPRSAGGKIMKAQLREYVDARVAAEATLSSGEPQRAAAEPSHQ
jgi:non-ribosomal peptide synthetase component E (peptide arylation enzyme)